MSSAQRSTRTYHRRRYPSKSSSPRKELTIQPSQDCQKLQALLQYFPEASCGSLKVIKCVGEGTFSKVFLVKDGDKKIAVKHLVPTASPDRILMEIDCLKMAEGKHNVLQLLFVHRHLGDVILAMPYIECTKFADVIRTMDHVEVRAYMRNLFKALAHIHSLGIIHRDIKPANFLYDRKKKLFKLVDFGLAQRMNSTSYQEPKLAKHPQCKRKLTSSDLANSMESPPPSCSHGTAEKKRRIHHPSGERGASRKVLSDKTTQDLNVKSPLKGTPTKDQSQDQPDDDFYDRRGAIMSARKRTRSSTRQQRPKLSDDCDPSEDESQDIPKTPNKNVENIKATPEVRRSPRKHPGSSAVKPGFSQLTISGSVIVNERSSTSLRRQGSFTILDPASGVPSDAGTPRLQASLTSRHSALMIPASNSAAGVLTPTAAATAAAATASFNWSLGGINPFLMGQFNYKESATMTLPMAVAGRFAAPNLKKDNCSCFGKPKVCSKCLSRRPQRAARAGTPGFRPPEVLLKVEHQTTAVDMWAAGVILLCILSRTYPFFRAPDDYHALAELVALFGSKAVQEAASQYGKRFICSENVAPLDFQILCQKLAERRRSENSSETASSLCLATELAIDLLSKILTLSSHERWTAENALAHPFFED